MKTSEFIAQARDHLHQGWAKGSFVDGEGNCCVIGALKRTAMENLMEGGIQAYSPAEEAVRKKLAAILGLDNEVPLPSIPSMNDAISTTKDDVENAMDKAVIEAEEAGE